MEQHPVPQNVTTFQFRLIGDMTLKQFGYLAGGAVLAYIIYKIPLPSLITIPLAAFSFLAGIGLAFVPIEERPMDVWVLSFLKSIYSPTQYIWTRHAPRPPAASSQRTQLTGTIGIPRPAAEPTKRGVILNNIFLPTSNAPASSAVIVTKTPKRGMFDWFFELMKPKQKTVPPVLPQTITQTPRMDFSLPPIVRRASPHAETRADVQQRESALEEKLRSVTTQLQEKNAAQSRILELQAQLTELISEREKMSRELQQLRKQEDAGTVPTPATVTTTQAPQAPTIQIIQPGRAVKVGLPRLTTFPNIVTGIVKDKDKNLLPGVLVTVKDKEGVPLRALKTNRLGQFAASTQLPNGTYLVEIEDPRLRYTFDRAQITLNGTVVPALEIFAKTEKEITRAKLEKELFGRPNT